MKIMKTEMKNDHHEMIRRVDTVRKRIVILKKILELKHRGEDKKDSKSRPKNPETVE